MRSAGNKAEVHVDLAPCQCEVDMTLVDRVHSLLNRLPLATAKNGTAAAAGGAGGARSTLDPSVYHVSFIA